MILLNLGILEDRLSIRPEIVCGDLFHEMQFLNVRPMPRLDNGAYSTSTLYLTDWRILSSQQEAPHYLICVGGGKAAEAFFRDKNIFGMIYPETTDRIMLFSEIQDIFDHFQQLHSDYRSMLISQHSMHEIVNAASSFFECFSVLFDVHCNVLESCSNYLPGMPCSPEESAARTGQLIEDLTLSVRKRQPENVAFKAQQQLEYIPQEGATPAYYLSRFFDGNRCIAMYIVCAEPNPLRKDSETLFRYVVNLMSPCIVGRFNPSVKTFSHIRSAISSIIDNISFNYSTLSDSLSKVGWGLNDTYQLVYIRIRMGSARNLYTVTDYYRYENLFPDCIAVKARSYVVVVVHNSTDSIIGHSLEGLQQLMTDYRMECIVSLPFGDFMQIREHFNILLSAMNMSEPRESITLYRDIMSKHIVSEMSINLPVRSLCHLSAVKIHEYDLENGTELLPTLEQYLRHNQSLQEASEEMYIHRNTLNYRLKTCMKIADLHLDSPEERLHLLFSCIVLLSLEGQSPSHQILSER